MPFFRLDITGSLVIEATSFKEADQLLKKAFQAVCLKWDYDMEGVEVKRDVQPDYKK